jgi:hypothetical protein
MTGVEKAGAWTYLSGGGARNITADKVSCGVTHIANEEKKFVTLRNGNRRGAGQG